MAIATSSVNPAKGPVAAYEYYAYDPVIYETPDGRDVPDLATTWGYVGTGNTTFEFTLRKGMTFADGTPVTATAVKNSLDYFLKADGPNISYAGPVKSISVVSESTVRITYSSPYPDAVDSLTQDRNFGLIIGPAGLADPASLETTSDGVGHYNLDASQTTPGNVYTFTPDRHYFNQDAIKYAKVQLKPMTDPAARLAALQSGQIQFAQRIPSTNAATAKSAGKKIVQGSGGLSVLVLEDRDGAPLNNQKVRQALQHAIDRDSIVKAIYGG
jgi:peptide/nickel transport system substrate-binding protein